MTAQPESQALRVAQAWVRALVGAQAPPLKNTLQRPEDAHQAWLSGAWFTAEAQPNELWVPPSAETPLWRAQVDALALRYSFPGLQDILSSRPSEPRAGMLFDQLLQVRIEAEGAQHWKGVAVDAAQAHLHTWASGQNPFGQALCQMYWQIVTGAPQPDSALPLPDGVAAALAALPDQPTLYGQRLAALASTWATLVALPESPTAPSVWSRFGKSLRKRFTTAPVPDQKAQPAPGPRPDTATTQESAAAPYRVFTHTHDAVLEAAQLGPLDVREALWLELEREKAPYRSAARTLAQRLQRWLQQTRQRTWRFELEEGVLDHQRLPRLVTDPFFAYPYREEQRDPAPDTVLTLLLDNSRSMRGKPLVLIGLCAGLLAEACERVGISVEILGFTTAPRGQDPAQQAWEAAGRPSQPGRVAALRHIIYKKAGCPWRAARKNLGWLLHTPLLGENIDGEALLWAKNRLLARPEPRKILIVLGDCQPMDRTTVQANGSNYLEAHLRQAIASIEQVKGLSLAAIGTGSNVHRFYNRAIHLNQIDLLSSALFGSFLRKLLQQQGKSLN